jgi:peptide/nickel transport system permease protein
VPGLAGPVLALTALQCGAAILTLSTLGFLGFGVSPPTPEWGMLIAEGRKYMASAWWLTALPGLAVAATVASLSLVATHLKEGRPS